MTMRIGILGAGAVGCVVGGLLTKAGHDVTLMDQWPEHVETLKRQGLRLSGTCGDHQVSVKALHLHEMQRITEPFDAIFIAVKSYDTEWATALGLAYLARPDGSDERQLTNNGASNWAPSFHPDGKTIVFASNLHAPRGGKFSIYAMNVDGTGLRRITTHDGFDGFPCFSPDGTKLVFISNRNGKDPRKDLNVFIADWR